MNQIKTVAISVFLSMILMATMALAQSHKLTYQIFSADGTPVTYWSVLDSLPGVDVVLFGELHNNAISHWLQLELAIDMHQADTQRRLVLGAEMFERDDQLLLDEYLSGVIRERDFEAAASLWHNYKTDYKPLVNFALENNLPFVATNIPRRYAALVNRLGFEGLDSLTPEAKRMIAPLPLPYDPDLPGYSAMASMGGPAMQANLNLPKAQAMKDATMAWFIARKLEGDARFLHFNGSYHSDNQEGIVWYLHKYAPELKVMTISTVVQEDVSVLDVSFVNRANFILVVNSRVTNTY